MTHGIASNHHGALSHGLVLRTRHLHRHVLQSHSTHSFLGEAQTEAVSDGGGVTLLILPVVVVASSSLTIRAITAIDVVRTLTTGGSSLVAQTSIGLARGVAVDAQVVGGHQTETSHRSNLVTCDGAVDATTAVPISVDGTVAVQNVVVSTGGQNNHTAFLRSILLVQDLASLEQVLNDQIATSVTVRSTVKVDTSQRGTTRHLVQNEQTLTHSELSVRASTNRTNWVDIEGSSTVGRSSGDHTVSTRGLTVHHFTHCPVGQFSGLEVSAQGNGVGANRGVGTTVQLEPLGIPILHATVRLRSSQQSTSKALIVSTSQGATEFNRVDAPHIPVKLGFIQVINRSISNQQVINGDDLFADHAFVTLTGDEVTRTVVAAGETTRDREACALARRDGALHGQVFEDRLTIESSQNFSRKDFQEVGVFTLIVTGGGASVILNAVNTTNPAERCKIRHRQYGGRSVYVRSLSLLLSPQRQQCLRSLMKY